MDIDTNSLVVPIKLRRRFHHRSCPILLEWRRCQNRPNQQSMFGFLHELLLDHAVSQAQPCLFPC